MVNEDRTTVGYAPGKIILSGEYAVLFGKQGIAVPSQLVLSATYRYKEYPLSILVSGYAEHPGWKEYISAVVKQCEQQSGEKFTGILAVSSGLPLGKGMGSSTALVITIAKCLLGKQCEAQARAIEDVMNPGHSGIDFEVIWNDKPILFHREQHSLRGSIQSVPMNISFLNDCTLIDTGRPNEGTPELVHWVKGRQQELQTAIDSIGKCTERLLTGESPLTVFPDHHKAQVALGVVPPMVQELVERIEKASGAAKILGAGGRTGGGGIVLAIHERPNVLQGIAQGLPIL